MVLFASLSDAGRPRNTWKAVFTATCCASVLLTIRRATVLRETPCESRLLQYASPFAWGDRPSTARKTWVTYCSLAVVAPLAPPTVIVCGAEVLPAKLASPR